MDGEARHRARLDGPREMEHHDSQIVPSGLMALSAEDKSRLLDESIGTADHIVFTADPDGNIEWVNGRGYDYTGQTGDGNAWSRESIHPDDLHLVMARWEEARRTDAYESEHRLRRHDGEYRWFLSRAWPLRGKDGTISHWFGTATDVHTQKMTEQALRDSHRNIRIELEGGRFRQEGLEELDLAQFIDVAPLQSFLADLYELTHIPVTFVDLDGTILVGVGWQDICAKYHHAYPASCTHCVESDTRLSADILPGEFRIYRCKNNMWDMATPLLVGGRHVGNILSGQFFLEDDEPDRELFRSQAQLYGFDEDEYMAAFDAVPRLSRESVERGMALLMKLGHLLSQLYYYRVKHAEAEAESHATLNRLEILEENLKRLERATHAGTWRYLAKTDSVIFSEGGDHIFGLETGRELMRSDLLRVVHLDDQARVAASWSALLEGNPQQIEYRLVTTSSVIPVRETAEPEFDGNGLVSGAVGVVQVISPAPVVADSELTPLTTGGR